ncbi:fatty acid synthase [Trichonephila clavata]|uniref:oleoyl-[acyl-carrier-protein] hydrolase n=1 Tax=Trichonephila clavata TaxID=2740835 RepID=A0A8X6JCM2_TRICU|nr:fatty acid synthase [Trichonephila clavata]
MVLQSIRDAGLTLNHKKCRFGQRSLKILGHLVDKNGIRPDPGKVEAVLEFPTPQTVTQVRSFLGICSYYRRFVHNFADIARPLHELLKQDVKFVWKEHQSAFIRLKSLLTRYPVLGFFKPEAKTLIHTDASGYGIGAILVQIQRMELFSKNISFHGILLDSLWDNTRASSSAKKEFVQLLYDGIASGCVRPLNSIVFDYKEVEKAFRYMASGKHIGKVVIKIRSEEPEINAAPTPVRVLAIPHTLFNPEQSYVIIGGLGGFGLELCQWMVERGAKHIILTSRSGIRTGYQKLCMNRWKKEGANIIISTENTVNINEAKLLLQKATSIKPVGGIFNLALILRDAFMENQTVRNFEEVCAPKVTSTVNLDALSRDLCPHLQWFLCFSSVSSGRGNAGQTNYGYANSVMERICEQRTLQGLPSLAIQWGPIGDVGVLQDTVGSDVVLRGTTSQSIRSCLSVLDKFLQQKHPVVLSCIPYIQEEISSSRTSKLSILSAVGKIFGISNIASMNKELSLVELGMDSLMEVELRHLLEHEFDHCPSFGIQFTSEAPEDSFEKVAAWYWMRIQRLNVGQTIVLAGYSFGSFLVFEMVLQAESQPLQHPEVQNIIFLDGSPAILKAYVKKFQSPGVKRDVDLLFSFVIILGVEINSLEFKKELMRLSSSSERIKCTAQKLNKSYINMTQEDLQVAVNLFFKKAMMAIQYSPKSKVRNDVMLIKSEETFFLSGNTSESFDLEKDCDGYITLHTVKGSHKTFIEGEGAEEVARLLNDISFSEMLPDMHLSRT